MRIVPVDTKINFLARWKMWVTVSVVFVVASVISMFVPGLNYGIDFSGGTLVQTQTERAVPIEDLRAALTKENVKGFSIQTFDGADDEFLIRLAGEGGSGVEAKKNADLVTKILTPLGGNVDIRRVEFVGPQIGDELKTKGLIALLTSLFAILIYISMRFEMRFALGAIAALAHDIFLTVGVFVLLQKEMTMAVLAALLTIIGYSLNDTIVVFDRVRENRRKYHKREMIDVLNLSVNEMLNRTLMTSLTTLAVLLALFFLGGGVIHDFAFTLMFGVLVGTYSSIFIASPIVLMLENYYQNLPKDETPKGFISKDGAQV